MIQSYYIAVFTVFITVCIPVIAQENTQRIDSAKTDAPHYRLFNSNNAIVPVNKHFYAEVGFISEKPGFGLSSSSEAHHALGLIRLGGFIAGALHFEGSANIVWEDEENTHYDISGDYIFTDESPHSSMIGTKVQIHEYGYVIVYYYYGYTHRDDPILYSIGGGFVTVHITEPLPQGFGPYIFLGLDGKIVDRLHLIADLSGFMATDLDRRGGVSLIGQMGVRYKWETLSLNLGVQSNPYFIGNVGGVRFFGGVGILI